MSVRQHSSLAATISIVRNDHVKYGSPTYTSSVNYARGCRRQGYDDSSPDIHPSELKVTAKIKVFVHAWKDRR